MKNIVLIFLAIISFGLYACKTQHTASDNAEITETYWRLTELKGKPVGLTPADKREVYIKLKKEGNQLEGFAGCNAVGGHFELMENSAISFSNIMGTMTACGDLTNENKLLEALRIADNYYHHGKLLILYKGKTMALARFEAIYFK